MKRGNAGAAPRQDAWHARAPEAVLQHVGGAPQGLTFAEARKRLAVHGPNLLPPPRRRGALMRLLLQFHNPLIYVLLAAAIVTLWLEDHVDAAVILGVVVINAAIGFVQEGKAERALEAVRAMLAIHAAVLRSGERHEIEAAALVPGDVVLLEPGTRVPADLRLLQARNLRIGEAALTGESLDLEKSPVPVAQNAAIGDRTCMAYSGTTVGAGQGRGVVVATGAATEIGRIGRLVGEVAGLATPLTRRLDQFARQITVFILVVGLLTFLYGRYVVGMPTLDIFLAVVGLAVAAIPEGLPAIVTITLAIGTTVMARSRAIVRRLPRPPAEPLITRVLLARIAYVSGLMIAVAFAAFHWELGRGSSVETARTAAVNMLVVGELVYLFNVRHFTAHAFHRDALYGNRVAFWASVVLIVLQLAFTYTAPMQELFKTTALDAASWLLITALGLAKFLAVEAEKWLLRRLGIVSM